MYPNLYYVFQDWFGLDWQFLKIFNTFGFFVAIAFIVAAYVLTNELKRKQQQGLFVFIERQITIGSPANTIDLFINFLVGFIFGYKIIGVLLTQGALNDPQDYLLSSKGNLIAGLLIGLLSAGFVYYEANKNKLENPQQKTLKIWPHDRVGDIVVYAFVFGFLGAKIFHNLENWNTFIKDPIGALISFDGLTFYGGLICAATAIYFYAIKNKIPFIHLADAAAPALMIAYAIGRIGCQCSGDGDWGIINDAFITNNTGQILHATSQQFAEAVQQHHPYLLQHFGTLEAAHHINVQPISWLPQWLFGYNYPHNVIREGEALINCNFGQYCNALPFAVFPTPFYETMISIIFFFILFANRNKIKSAGAMFGFYLMLNGFERFWVEKIRVNTLYNILGFHPTQAEIIATLLFIVGLVLVVVSKRKSAAASS
jgi:phosphatidylglycerol---prolipoprotein diacylglyceryl transferase